MTTLIATGCLMAIMALGGMIGYFAAHRGRRRPAAMPTPMAAEELHRALGQVRPETPLWRAVHHLLAEDIIAAMNTAADKRAANRPGDMAHAAGGLSWLLDFRDRLALEAARAQRVEKREPEPG